MIANGSGQAIWLTTLPRKNAINDPGSEREVHNHTEDEKPNSQDVPIGLVMQQEESAAADGEALIAR